MPPKYLRRALSIPIVVIFTLLMIVLLPIWLPIAATVDLLTGPSRMRNVRLGFVLLLLGINEIGTLVVVLGRWASCGLGTRIRTPKGQRRMQPAIAHYVTGLMRCTERALGVRYVYEGVEAIDQGGPLMVFGHHTSLIDSALPAYVLVQRAPWQIRYVIKKTLAYAPAFDIGGHLLPIHFVDRTGKKTSDERAALVKLAQGMANDEAAVIFPEGTFYNPARLARAVERLRTDAPHLVARAERLRHTLPPRAGGALAMLAGAPDVDVLFMAHAGLEGFSSLGRIVKNTPLREPLRVKCWRVPAAQIPKDPDAQFDWLFGEFERMDRWVVEQLDGQQAKVA